MSEFPKLIEPEQRCPNGHPLYDVDGILRKDAEQQTVTRSICPSCNWTGQRLVHKYELIARERGISIEDAIQVERHGPGFKIPEPSITQPLPGQTGPEADAQLKHNLEQQGKREEQEVLQRAGAAGQRQAAGLEAAPVKPAPATAQPDKGILQRIAEKFHLGGDEKEQAAGAKAELDKLLTDPAYGAAYHDPANAFHALVLEKAQDLATLAGVDLPPVT